jgi:hypothetical protein
MKSLLILLLSTLLTVHAFADEVVKSGCQQPPIPSTLASDLVLKQFEKHSKAYKECIDKFVSGQQIISKNSTDTSKANAAQDASELAIKEFNEYMTELNERNGRTPGADNDEN